MRLTTLFLLAVLPLAAPARAQDTLHVNTTWDGVDFGGNQQVADLPGPDGQLTIREAVFAANNTPGPQVIGFHIPLTDPGYWAAGGVFSIFFNTFPSTLYITDDGTTIDGSTQTAFTGDTNPNGPEISLLMSTEYSGHPAIVVESDDNVFRSMTGPSLTIRSYDVRGDRNRFEGCVIRGLRENLLITGADNVIGGTAPGQGNLISGGLTALTITGAGATGNVVQGNRITSGHDRGLAVLDGASDNLIGGSEPGARNVIAANGHTTSEHNPVGTEVVISGSNNVFQGNYVGIVEDGSDGGGLAVRGVSVSGTNNRIVGNVIGGYGTYDSEARYALSVGGTGTVVQGNVVGVDPVGGQPRPSTVGIFVSASARDALIGGTEPGQGNVVAYSETYGIGVNGPNPATQAALLGNRTFGNGGTGIDLGVLGASDGPTANDPGDADEGSNRYQNTPVLADAAIEGPTLVVRYAVDSAPANATYPLRIEVFRAAGDEGERFVGAGVYTEADYAAGTPGTATLTLPADGLAEGDSLIATATDADGHTSEFSATAAVIAVRTVGTEGVAPDAFRLSAATPNPARERATLTLALGRAQAVTVAVYDMLGRTVAVLHNGTLAAGTHALRLDAGALPSGAYVVRASADGRTTTQRLSVIR